MALNSEQLLGQIQSGNDLLGQYEQLGRGGAEQAFREAIVNQLGGFEPLQKDIAAAGQEAYGTFDRLRELMSGQNDPINDPSALGQLGRGIGEFGRLTGVRDSLNNILKLSGGRVEDIVGRAADAYFTPAQAAQARLERLQPLFQTAVSTEESQRNRDFQAQQAALDRAATARAAAQADPWAKLAEMFNISPEELKNGMQAIFSDSWGATPGATPSVTTTATSTPQRSSAQQFIAGGKERYNNLFTDIPNTPGTNLASGFGPLMQQAAGALFGIR